jgi:hypothetical protein
MTPSIPILKDPLSETLFPILKDEKQWDIYQRATKAQARAHNLSDIFDDTYVPTTPIDIQLLSPRHLSNRLWQNMCSQS